MKKHYSKMIRCPRKLTTLKRHLHCFFRVIWFKLEPPQFCLIFVNSYTKIDTLSLELHKKGLKSHDLIIYRILRYFLQLGQKSMIFWF